MILRRLTTLLQRLRADRRGNVLIIFGFAAVPLIFATGMTIDYTRAARMQTKLNAVADAAALAAVTPAMMRDTPFNAGYTSYQSWYSQAQLMPDVIYDQARTLQYQLGATSASGDDGTLHLQITDTNTTGLTRTATVTYAVSSPNMFGGFLGMSKIAIGGTATATSTNNPNIDFYLLLDASGSMSFPSTSAGLTQLTSLTGGCAFACHSTNDATARSADGTYKDYYGVAKSYNIPLRIDEEGIAVQNLMSLASNTASQKHVQYRMSLSSFSRLTKFNPAVQPLTTNLTLAGTSARNVTVEPYYTNNCFASGQCNNDTDTALSDAFTRMNALMPAPGNGTNTPPDKPQQIMFVVTDGMRDETRPSGRPEVTVDGSLCTAIKNRNIRIAILYTEYLPASLSDGWSQANVAPYLSQVEPALTSCASPGLFYKVTTDQDISAALAALFQTATATARLSQ